MITQDNGDNHIELLNQYFKNYPKAALGFSGGCDSAFLLASAVKAGVIVQPYFVKGAFQPAFELQDARKICEELGIELKVLTIDPLQNHRVSENGPRRCYYCKQLIFSTLTKAAYEDGCSLLWDGTNASDAEDERPGMQALRELGVQSPLRIAKLTKNEIREYSRQLNIFTWDKPAYACLATRIPTGVKITQQDLTRAERAEMALFKMGFSNLRVRVTGNTAKLQLPESQFEKATILHRKICEELNPWFENIVLDLSPRSEVL